MAGHAVTPVLACVAMVVGGYRGAGAENKDRVTLTARFARSLSI
jgi:hypothetical protein